MQNENKEKEDAEKNKINTIMKDSTNQKRKADGDLENIGSKSIQVKLRYLSIILLYNPFISIYFYRIDLFIYWLII